MNSKTLGKNRSVMFLILMFVVSISLTGCESSETITRVFEVVKLIGVTIFGGASTDAEESTDTEDPADDTDTEIATDTEVATDTAEITDDDEGAEDDRQNTPPQETTTENLE
ncbi:MAG: hypothetical protein ACD_39C01737G0002 [uncultured bacterium]|nr:MAG: hypothetical protein ACD_39C01737G0002 [uncultured bacterium]